MNMDVFDGYYYHKRVPPREQDVIIDISNGGDTMNWIVPGPYPLEIKKMYEEFEDDEQLYEGPIDEEIIKEVKTVTYGRSFYFQPCNGSDIQISETKTLNKISIPFGIPSFCEDDIDRGAPIEDFKIWIKDNILYIEHLDYGNGLEEFSKGLVLVHSESIDHWEFPIDRPADYRKFKVRRKKCYMGIDLIISYPKKEMAPMDGEIQIIK